MQFPIPLFRITLAVVLLLAQLTGGFARVVHCYDSHCESAGMNWECHIQCSENHGADGQTCGHQDDSSRNKHESDDRENHYSESLVKSAPCGSDHHHHYVAAVALICIHGEASVGDHLRGLFDVACLEPVRRLFTSHALRPLLALDRGIGFHPAIPLVLRLRI